MDPRVARRALVIGLVLGLLAEFALDGPALGLNVPVIVGATLIGAIAFRQPGRRFDPLDAWLPVGAIVLAALVAVRGDDFLAALDTLGATAFGGAAVIAIAGTPVTRRSVGAFVVASTWLCATAIVGVRRVLGSVRPRTGNDADGRWPRLAPLARGLTIGIPLALIFALLFASADPIFRQGLDDLFGLRLDLGSLPGRIVFGLAAGWLAIGVLAAVIDGAPVEASPAEVMPAALAASSPDAASERPATEPVDVGAELPRETGLRLGALEATVILILVDAVVATFVVLQVAYLFGGLDTMAAARLTYSDYARRGFFELVVAAVLAGAVVATIESLVRVRSRASLGASLGLLVLTGVVLVSATLRLSLYQGAYGWTELRFYVFTAIVYVAVALTLLGLLVILRRIPWLPHGLVALGFVGLVGLNLAAPGAFVAERNLERVLHPSLVPADGRTGLDAEYLAVLPDDAIPPIVDALQRLPDAEREVVNAILAGRLDALAGDPALTSPWAWNLGRERAKSALSTVP